MTRQHITSRQNERVKAAAKLRDRRRRERQQRIVIDGAREIGRAISAGVEIDRSLCVRVAGDERRCGRGRLANCTVAERIWRPSPTRCSPNCALARAAMGWSRWRRAPRRSLEQIQLPPAALVAVIEGVEKPGNVGAVLRSADGAGVDAVIVADGRSDLFNPNTIRASLGTVFGAGVCEASSTEALAWLQRMGLPIYAAKPQADASYTEADYRRGACDCPGKRGRRPVGRVEGSGSHSHRPAHARHGRQPERVGHRGRAVLRSPAAAAAGAGKRRHQGPSWASISPPVWRISRTAFQSSL